MGILTGMTYTRKRLIESQLKLWRGLREDYTRYRDAEIEATPDWHTYHKIVLELNDKIKHAELAWKETK